MSIYISGYAIEENPPQGCVGLFDCSCRGGTSTWQAQQPETIPHPRARFPTATGPQQQHWTLSFRTLKGKGQNSSSYMTTPPNLATCKRRIKGQRESERELENIRTRELWQTRQKPFQPPLQNVGFGVKLKTHTRTVEIEGVGNIWKYTIWQHRSSWQRWQFSKTSSIHPSFF